MIRPFRFGLQYRLGRAEEIVDQARRAEAAGFDVFHSWDHVVDGWAPLSPLLAAALATTTLRVCPLVINNDFHHPVHLAREVTAMDQLTGGRVELGIGAGHAFTEYAAVGQPFDPPAVRKRRLAESVEILRQLFDEGTASFAGEHYSIHEAHIQRPAQDHLPIMVAVNGEQPLAHAAAHGDTIGLMMLGKTLPDGARHEVRWQSERLDATVAHICASVPAGRDVPELNALVQVVVVTDDRRAAAEQIAAEVEGLSVEDALETPFLALGTTEEIVEHLLRCRERWGISYYSVRDLDAIAPVIAALRAQG